MIFEASSAAACFPEGKTSSRSGAVRNWAALAGVTAGTALTATLGSLASADLSLLVALPTIALAGGVGAIGSTFLLKPLQRSDVEALAESPTLVGVPGLIAALRRAAR